MQRVTAIVHLNGAGSRISPAALAIVIGALRGVDAVGFEPEEALVTVRFDHDLAGLPDIVQALEDVGLDVASIALRHAAAYGMQVARPRESTSGRARPKMSLRPRAGCHRAPFETEADDAVEHRMDDGSRVHPRSAN